MPRACTKCGRVVAEAAYCPFCSEPTIEHIPVPEKRSDIRTILTVFAEKNPWLEYVAIISMLIAFPGALAIAFVSSIGIACFVFFGAVLLFTMLYAHLPSLRCPRCEKNLAHQTGQNIRYCPYCGVDLAVEIYPKSQEVTEFLKKVSGQPGVEIKNTDIQLPPRNRKGNTDIQLPLGNEEKRIPK